MKIKLSHSRTIVVATIVASTLLIGIVVVFPNWFDKHTGAAAWVQAIGAVAIVLATSWIASLNLTEEHRRRRESERQLWQALAMISERCVEPIFDVVKAIEHIAHPEQAFVDHYCPSDLDAPLEGLAAVPLHQLGDVQMVYAVITLRRVMARIRAVLDARHAQLTSGSSETLVPLTLGNDKTDAFNAHASIMRLTYGAAAEAKLTRFN